MTEKSIHQAIVSFGILPMTLVLKQLEYEQRFEECLEIKNAIEAFNKRFSYYNHPTQYSEELEKEYYEAMGELTKTDCKIAKGNMEYYIREINKKLEL